MKTEERVGDFLLCREGNRCELKKYHGPGGAVTVPDEVTEIGCFAFDWKFQITEVALPPRLTGIGAGAFRGCANLTGLTLPAGVREIGGGAFENCVSLRRVKLPAGLRAIGGAAFYGCRELRELALPQSLRHIGTAPFDPRYLRRLLGLVPLMLGGRCRICPLTFEALLRSHWSGTDDFFEGAAYLASGRKAVMTLAREQLLEDPAWAVEVLADLLDRFPTARRFRKAGELVRDRAPALWPKAYETFYALAQAKGLRRAMRRLDAVKRQTER